MLFGQRTLDFRSEEGDWLSWLEHYLDMVGVTGSSPVSPSLAGRKPAKNSADPRKTPVFSWVCLFRCARGPSFRAPAGGMAKRCSTSRLSRFAPPKRASSVLPHTGLRRVAALRNIRVCCRSPQRCSSRWVHAAPLAFATDASLPSRHRRPGSPRRASFRHPTVQ